MSERYTVTPRAGHTTVAYGYAWPGDGAIVTDDEVGADTLQRLDGDARFVVARDALADASPRPPDPKPSPRPRRKS